jgi:TetR/AcrR family transcriptional repressor of mexCD-oprJ operon
MEQNRARIVAAAIRVWSADPSAPLDLVASEAGVGRATLHRYFPGRADLLRAAALEGITALDAALQSAQLPGRAHHDALATMLAILVQFGDRLHFTLVAGELIGDAEVSAAEAEVDARLGLVLERAVEGGLLRAGVPTAWRFRAIEAMVYAAWTAVASGELAAQDAPGLVYDTVIRGLGV